MICPECNGRKWAGGEVPRLCQACGAAGLITDPDLKPLSAGARLRREQEDLHTWREASAFFAVCAALAESAGNPALVEIFRTLWEQADKRADELDEAELDRGAEDGELVVPPSHVWGRP